MSANTIGFHQYEGNLQIKDPGASGSITVDRSPAVVALVSTGAEARTLNRPHTLNETVKIYCKTYGGAITLTVTGGYNTNGDTTYAFSAAGSYLVLTSIYTGSAYVWREVASSQTGNLSGLTATATELNVLHSQTMTTGAAAGITGGTGTVYKNSLEKIGNIKKLTIMIDLTGLGSSTTDLDIIGQGASAAYIGQILAAEVGTVLTLEMKCLEAPATGVTDIDLYSATEATGKFDDAVTGLTETALITSGGAWTNGRVLGCTTVPAANEYIYLTCGAGGTVGTYTAGKFLITICGY